jgi:thiol-disulfide isomerase/thioredoxin
MHAMLKKLVAAVILLLTILVMFQPVGATEETKPIYFFWSKSCPHCLREKAFLKELAQDFPRLDIKDYEISSSQENLELFQKVGRKFSNQGYTPFTVVGEFHFIGYLDDETTGKEIREAVECYLADGCRDVVAELIETPPEPSRTQKIPETLDLPLIGEIKTANLSLPALTFVIALLDGFNPCAMWVLLFLISMLLGMKDRKRMWLLGTTFIFASGLVYFLFMTAWLNLFMFLGFVLWVRILIGLVALGVAVYSLRDYWVNREMVCKVTEGERRQKVFAKIKEITQQKGLVMALVGIVLLAFTVNLVELVCSAGLPAIYTQVLALTDLPRWQYYAYLVFYILIFMLDDLFVFVVAMTTLRATGAQTKYARYSRLIGGILMLVIGGLLLFKPEWLMFG